MGPGYGNYHAYYQPGPDWTNYHAYYQAGLDWPVGPFGPIWTNYHGRSQFNKCVNYYCMHTYKYNTSMAQPRKCTKAMIQTHSAKETTWLDGK